MKRPTRPRFASLMKPADLEALKDMVADKLVSAQKNQVLTSRPRCTVTPPCRHCWYCREWVRVGP